MEQITSLKLANEVIAKLSNLIEYEYEFAKFNHHEYARDSARFKDAETQRNYLLWSGGRLEEMEHIKQKHDEIFEDVIKQLLK